ncbi:MAG: hypothetical protein KAS63_00490 [Candidatus Heimdallarchaeota archaeon]|nr:hypothetical protein [Candidatus Heimdallarchaeota archaeon]MCK4953821.1 hypothetical protein [Candidatus Heimdallarchaeota archaeon]
MSENTQKCPSCTESVPLEYSVCPFCGFGLLEYELKKFAFKPKLKEVFIRLYNFFRHPFKTSEEFGVATESKGGNLILLIFSLFLSLRFYVVMFKAGLQYSFLIVLGNPERFHINITIGLILFFVTLLLLPLMIWIIYKLLFALGTWIISKIAAMLGSDASTKQFRTIVGYSIAPVAIGELLGIIFTLLGPSGNVGSPDNFQQFATYVLNLYDSIWMTIFSVIMIIMWIIMIVYATIGLRTVGRMSWITAALAIALPIGLFVFFFYVYGMFGI